MADEHRAWSQNVSHELSSSSYGHYGITVYNQTTQRWEFPRHPFPIGNNVSSENHEEQKSGFLEVLTEAEVVVEPSIGAAATDYKVPSGLAVGKELPELAPAYSLIKPARKHHPFKNSALQHGSQIAFGSAVWLGTDQIKSGNLTFPLIAFVTGIGSDSLSLACLGQKQVDLIARDSNTQNVRIPSLAGISRISWTVTEPILQVLFSQRDSDGGGDTFLCMRQASRTTIFEPLLRRDTTGYTPSNQDAPLDFNLLVAIDTSVTGGNNHVDAAFNPHDHREVVIIDEEGNWSTWRVNGRRSTTARVLYQARLETSGRIFSWKDRKRPEGIGLYFDGWHKVIWTSSDGQNVNRLLVCNRQSVQLFDYTGEEVQSIDPRLDLQKTNSYVLDARPGPRISICIILTTSSVLMYDFTRPESNYSASQKVPTLLCHYRHLHNPADMILKMTDLIIGSSVWLGLYSSTKYLDMRQIVLSKGSETSVATVSDQWSLALPIESSESLVATIILARSESTNERGDQSLVHVVLQREDLSISTFLTVATFSQPPREDGGHCFLRLPPLRNTYQKSERLIDSSDSEDDGANFIVLDAKEEDWSEPPISLLSESANETNKNTRCISHLPKLVDTIQTLHDLESRTKALFSVSDYLNQLRERLDSTVTSEAAILRCMTLLDVVDNYVQVKDIENDSVLLEDMIRGKYSELPRVHISTSFELDSRSLLTVYEKIFTLYIDSLPQDVPNQVRVRREREHRKIALEQLLSGYVVRRAFAKTDNEPGRVQPRMENLQMLLSDPVPHNVDSSLQDQDGPVSQPLPGSSSTVSPLMDALSRLSCFTRNTRIPDRAQVSNAGTTEPLSSILSHLPTSSDVDPDDYDYVAVNSSLVATEDSTAAQGKQAIRRGGKTRRAKLRAADPGTRFKATDGEGNDKTGEAVQSNDTKDHRNTYQHTGVLPIRMSRGALSSTILPGVKASNPQTHPLSDGHLGGGGSSQAASQEALMLTQPERGVFASRAGTHSESKTKRKKKRVAGF